MGTFSEAQEIAWAAGLFEGEGCFTVTKVKQWTYARAVLGMTDEDSVRRFHKAVGVGNVYTRKQRAEWKQQWVWAASGKSAEAVITLLWDGLGARRQARASEVLASAAESPKRQPKTHCKHGHEFTPENTRVLKRGERVCRECSRRHGRDFQRRKRMKEQVN